MRIIAGRHRGRPLSTPKGQATRPTSDKAREAVFNVLEHGIDGPGLAGARIADVFAGTGAFGLEALSRGAQAVLFVEKSRDALAALRANIDLLGEADACTLIETKATALIPPPGGPVDYAFLDAPYGRGLTQPALENLAGQGWLKPGAILTVEIAADEALEIPEGFEVLKDKAYGAAKVLFLCHSPALSV